MKIFNQKITAVLGIVMAGIMSLLGLFTTYADDNDLHATMTISPGTYKVTMQPGQSYKSSFELVNTGTSNLDYKAYVTPYSFNDGDVNYETPNLDTSTSYTTMKDWITITDAGDGSLEPNERATISYSISVPENATPGGQYATIAIEQLPKDVESGNATVKQIIRGAMIIFGTVAGQVNNTGNVTQNNISSFFFNPPISATSLVENTGNVHSDAEYILQVFPLFSNEEVYTNEEDPLTKTILPETRRFVTQSWDGAPSLGIFKVKQTVRFAGNESVTEKIVIICPMWLVFLVIFGVVFLIVYLIARSKMRKGSSSSKPAHSTPAA